MSSNKASKFDSRVGIQIPSESDLGDVFAVSQLLYVANQFVSETKSCFNHECESGSLIKKVRRHKFSVKEIKERLSVPVYALEYARESSDPSKLSGSTERWAVECGDSLIIAAELMYNTAPNLFSSKADKKLLGVLEGDPIEKEVRANIQALATNERCLTIALRSKVGGTIPLKDFEWQEWLLRGLKSQRFRLLIRIRSNQGLFIQIQEELHDRIWRNFWFQRFLDTWLKTDIDEAEVRNLKMPDVMGYIGRFWSEYFYPSVDPSDVYLQPQGNFLNKLTFLISLRWHAHILDTVKKRVKAAAISTDRGSELSKMLSEFSKDAKKISERDLLSIRMNRNAAKAIGLNPVESSHDLAAGDSRNTEKEVEESAHDISSDERGAPETVEADIFDELDFVPTIMEQIPADLPSKTPGDDEEVSSVSTTNPFHDIDTKLIPVLGDNVDSVDLTSDSDFSIGSYVQIYINYKNYYYTLEKLDNNRIQMWLRGSNYATKGPIESIIDTKRSGKLSLSSALRLLNKEPDSEDVDKRWPAAGTPPFFTMIRKISSTELKDARKSKGDTHAVGKKPALFLMSRIICRYSTANDELAITIDGKNWKFNKSQAQKSIAIGRLPTNDIHLKGAAGISRRHSAIVYSKGTWYLIDLGSTNGTYYCGKILRRGKYDNKNWVALSTSSSSMSGGEADAIAEGEDDQGGDSTTMSTLQRELSS